MSLDFLQRVVAAQERALKTIREQGFVFDNLDDRWQKLAFALYAVLAELGEEAKIALEEAKAEKCARE